MAVTEHVDELRKFYGDGEPAGNKCKGTGDRYGSSQSSSSPFNRIS